MRAPLPLLLTAAALLLAACTQGSQELPRTHPVDAGSPTPTPTTASGQVRAGSVDGAGQLPPVRDLAEARARFNPRSDPNTIITETGPGRYRIEHRDLATGPNDTTGGADRQAALAHWRARGTRDYRIDVERECSCPARAYRIEVRDSRAVSIGPVDGSDSPAPDGLLMSVDDMFDLLTDASPPYQVQYDPTYGFPRSTGLPGVAGQRDQGTFTVSGYVPSA